MTGKETMKSLFDGRCDASQDADITLKFDDGSTLTAHSFILKKASTVLRSGLEDCENTTEVHLDSVTKEVWIDILSELYPEEHSVIITKVFTGDRETLLQMGKECVKYGIESVLGSMDKTIYHRVSAVKTPNLASWTPTLGVFAQVSSELQLSKSRGIIAECIISVMSQSKQQQEQQHHHEQGQRRHHKQAGLSRTSYSDWYSPEPQPSPSQNYPKEMLDAIRDLYDGGDHEWNTWFSRELMFKVFAIDVRPRNA